MPWKRAAACILAVASTGSAYRPLTQRGYLSTLTWLNGLLASELPLLSLVGQVSAVAVAGRRLPLPAAFATTVCAAGQLGLDRAGRRADSPLAKALDEGLGPDRLTDATELWPKLARPAAAPQARLMRTLLVRRRYSRHSDIPYGPYGARNMLDIWRHPDLPYSAKAPVLLQIPGGSWAVAGKRPQAYPLMSHLTERGWVCVSINYRLSPRHTWPAHLIDVKRAIAWTRVNIADYGGDPDFITITGGSAGGHLSSLAALTANDPQYQPEFTDADTSVQAAMPFYGVYDFTRTDGALHDMMVPFLERFVLKMRRKDNPAAFAAASSITHAHREAPPFFVLHGTNDSFIPVAQARSFASRLREVSTQPVVYGELPYAQHAFDVLSTARATHAAVAVEQFLADTYATMLNNLKERGA